MKRPHTFRRYPCAWWFVWLAFVKGIPAACGVTSVISTPEARYATWTLQIWGVQLTLAALVAGLGLAMHDARIQAWGFALLTLATTYDLIAVFYYYGLQQPAYTLLYVGFAVACVLRCLPRKRLDSDNVRVRGNGR